MKVRILKYLVAALIVFTVSCDQNKPESFSFVQLSDPQLGMGGYENDIKRLKQSVVQINQLDCDFVVICGDLVHHANDTTFADFKAIINGFDVPYYLAAGNHDVGNVPNDTTLGYYRKMFGKEYYDFLHKGYAFIVTNSQLWKNNIGEESEKHDTWFKETLEKSSADQLPVIVVGHYPLFIEEEEEEEKYFNFPIEKRLELLELFVDNNVQAYLSGHKHETVINNYQDIQLVTGETTSKNFDKRPFGFRLWEVSADTIKHQFVALQPVNSD